MKLDNRELSIRTESQIVEAARNGDVDSFGALYERYYAVMVWLAYSILLERDLAEDAAQETFALACEELAQLKRPEKFAGWLAGICRNVARQMARQRKREVLTNAADTVVEQNNNDDLVGMVRQAICGLPEMYRQPLLLRYYNDMSYEQIGLVLGIARYTVKGRLFRARRKIVKYLKRKGFE